MRFILTLPYMGAFQFGATAGTGSGTGAFHGREYLMMVRDIHEMFEGLDSRILCFSSLAVGLRVHIGIMLHLIDDI